MVELWQCRVQHPTISSEVAGEQPSKADNKRPAVTAITPKPPLQHNLLARDEPATGMLVSGFHGYAQKRIEAGSELHLRISAPEQDGYSVAIYRVGPGGFYGTADVPIDWPIVHTAAVAQPQPIYPGSYVRVVPGITGNLSELSIECWLRRWSANRWQGLVNQHDYPMNCSFGLFLDPDGLVRFYLGDGGAFVDGQLHTSLEAIPVGSWTHLVGTWTGTQKTLYINGKARESWLQAGPVAGNAVSLRMGAYGENGVAGNFLDGDLAMPALYSRALSSGEVWARYVDQGLTPPSGASVLASWPLTEESGIWVRDMSGNERHGRIINSATWMIGGPNFDSASVPVFGGYDPSADATRGHGLRLAADDLYDCDWQVTDRCQIPVDATPGIHAARLTSPSGQFVGDVTFVVRRSTSAQACPLVVLCATNTWLAYSAPPFAANPYAQTGWGTGSRDIAVPGTPATSCYLPHLAGQPTYHCGMGLPWPMAQAQVQYDPPPGYGHLVGAELPLHAWLREQGYDFDVLTDFDLHEDAAALDPHQVLLAVGHSEYWSTEAQTAVDRFLANGRDVIALSGNTMFWRVSFDPAMRRMECRKHALAGSTGAQVVGDVGTCYHSDDKRRGGLLRNDNNPGSAVLGLEPAGYASAPFATYTVTDDAHFLFQTPIPVGVTNGDILGVAVDGSYPRAVGHEWDVRVSLLGAPGMPPPGASPPPPDPSDATILASAGIPSAAFAFWDYYGRDGANQGTVSEIMYWIRPGGGRVFYAGSIATAWTLNADPRLATLLANVLDHFGVVAR